MAETSLNVRVHRAYHEQVLRQGADPITDRLEVIRSEIRVLENEIGGLDAICRFWGDIEEPSLTVRSVPSCF